MDDGGVKTSSCEEQAEDRISSFHDDILVHILSFLPTEDAIRTVLVPRFRHLWKSLPILSFDHDWYFDYPLYGPRQDGPFYHKKFLDYVRHVFILREKYTVDDFFLKLGLNFHYSKQVAAVPGYEDFAKREKRMASEVDSWVYFAMRKKVKVLALDFSVEEFDPKPGACYRLPSVVFRSECLAKVKLVCCEIKPIGKMQLNCLKRLFLEEIVFNDEIFNQILGGCSLMEELSLIRCYGLCRLGFRNSSIKSLTLFHERFPPFHERRVEISCPNIESLDVDGRVDFVDLVDVSSVVVSSISIDDLQFSPERYKMVQALCENLGHCKAFRLSSSCILVIAASKLLDEPGLVRLFGWKCVEFEIELTKWHLPGISFAEKFSIFGNTCHAYLTWKLDN